MTNANYLQLQLDTASKKRENVEKVVHIKEKRIADLEKQVREQQEFIVNSMVKGREMKNKCDHEKSKN